MLVYIGSQKRFDNFNKLLHGVAEGNRMREGRVCWGC
jgi:hypothetical protein